MGAAEDWQSRIIKEFKDYPRVTILNPRRSDFDAYAEQSITNSYFYGQVKWELDALDKAHIIAMYFSPETKSPITLLELGLHAQDEKLIVCCQKPYWRKGNVDMICERFNIPQATSIDSLIKSIQNALWGAD